MENDKIIVGGSNISGNITSCKIENQVLSVDKKSAVSIVQYTTYASYDVCSKQIIQRYVVPEFTGFGVLSLFLMMIISFVVLTTYLNRNIV